ncbi:hypothetical protein [Aureibacillus halotolerans]|uniref:Uncharacterized protein n=1 Tax=Aureibacillus halotolerans TaxID=1508390 RepID=A0A4V3D5R3_9BACI|nr:hypothetical protein [Aureibacillus halotolerans]TDQ41017.1 hypothetical protein EV213_10414 [Aureibacillus halotolerans]
MKKRMERLWKTWWTLLLQFLVTGTIRKDLIVPSSFREACPMYGLGVFASFDRYKELLRRKKASRRKLFMKRDSQTLSLKHHHGDRPSSTIMIRMYHLFVERISYNLAHRYNKLRGVPNQKQVELHQRGPPRYSTTRPRFSKYALA